MIMSPDQRSRFQKWMDTAKPWMVLTKDGSDSVNEPRDSSVQTACWSYDRSIKRHNIKIGHVLDIGNARVKKGGKLADEFLRSVYMHEVCHGLYTVRDPGVLKAEWIKHAPNNPQVWGLFEDIRIEAKYRKDNPGFRFRWGRFIDLKTETPSPGEWLFIAKSRECLSAPRKLKYTGPAMTLLGKPAEKVLRALFGYTARERNKPAFSAKRFIKHFGTSVPIPSWIVGDASNGADTASPSTPAPAPAPSGEPQASEPAPAPVQQPSPTDVPSVWRERGRKMEECRGVETSGADSFIYKTADIDWAAVGRVFQRLEGMCKRAGWTPETLANTGSRPHLPAVAVGRSDAFRRLEASRGRPKLLAVIDMSGSMRIFWGMGGLDFIAALMVMHRRGLIDGRFILTGEAKTARLGPMDIDPRKLEQLGPGKRCDSFAAALRSLGQDLAWADTVLCYTDGDWADGDINAGEYRKRGLDLIGTAISDSPFIRAKLCQQFGRAIMAPTAEQLGVRIVSYLFERNKA